MKISKEEKDILKSYEDDEWISTQHLDDDRKRIKEYARNALRKNRRVNIRISERDLAVSSAET
jgi:predicted DNA binding CopG/RHH family protein